MPLEESPYEKGRRHEKMIEERTGDKRVPGSGNQSMKPGDIRGDKFLREAKMTSKKGMSIKGEWLIKICRQALTNGLEPIIELRFEGHKPPTSKDWVMIQARYFDELTEEDI